MDRLISLIKLPLTIIFMSILFISFFCIFFIYKKCCLGGFQKLIQTLTSSLHEKLFNSKNEFDETMHLFNKFEENNKRMSSDIIKKLENGSDALAKILTPSKSPEERQEELKMLKKISKI